MQNAIIQARRPFADIHHIDPCLQGQGPGQLAIGGINGHTAGTGHPDMDMTGRWVGINKHRVVCLLRKPQDMAVIMTIVYVYLFQPAISGCFLLRGTKRVTAVSMDI